MIRATTNTCKLCGKYFPINGNQKIFCSKGCSQFWFNHVGHAPKKRYINGEEKKC